MVCPLTNASIIGSDFSTNRSLEGHSYAHCGNNNLILSSFSSVSYNFLLLPYYTIHLLFLLQNYCSSQNQLSFAPYTFFSLNSMHVSFSFPESVDYSSLLPSSSFHSTSPTLLSLTTKYLTSPPVSLHFFLLCLITMLRLPQLTLCSPSAYFFYSSH